MKINRANAFGIVLLVLWAAVSCANGSSDQAKQESSPASMANQADIKCLEDGYKLIPNIENGVPVGSWCMDLITKSRCDAWDYYRGDCEL